eukprot:4319004-Ditylum_brightwellii.AAC.1
MSVPYWLLKDTKLTNVAHIEIRYTSNDENYINGSKSDIKDCAFANNDSDHAEDVMKVDVEEKANFMGEK